MMRKELRATDISNVPELLKLAVEVNESREPRILRRNSEDLAILMPARSLRRRAKRPRTDVDYKAFLSSAGGWKGLVDTDKLKEDIRASRKLSSRPPVELHQSS